MVEDSIPSQLDRRTTIKLVGAAAATGTIAGCIGDDDATDDTVDDDDTAAPADDTTDDTADDDDTTADPPEEVALTVTHGVMPLTLDPHDHTEKPTENVSRQAYEGPLALDDDQNIVAELVTDWERLDEERIRLEVRDGVTFHDGTEMTAADVAYSINRIVDEDVGIVSRQSREVDATGAEVVDGGVEVVSDGPSPILFRQLAYMATVVQEDWAEETDPSEVAQSMRGTGPFQLEEYEEDVRVVFSRYDDYWRDLPDVTDLTMDAAGEDSTRINRLITDETDLVTNVPPDEVSRVREEGATIEAIPSTRSVFCVMRNDVSPFDDVQFRRALNYAVDQEEIVSEIMNGFAEPLSQPVFEGVFGHNPDLDLYPYDPDQAATLVEESGNEGVELTLETPVGRYLKDVEIAQAVGGYIDSLPNVSCTVDQRDFGEMIGEIVDGNQETIPEFYLIGWGNEGFDTDMTMIPHFHGEVSPRAFVDDELTELIEAAQTEVDVDEREGILQQANARARDQAGWIFLHRQYGIYGLSEGLEWQPRNDEIIFVKDIHV